MLDAKDILQIDATIIAGIFIFLTIGSIGSHPTIAQVVNNYTKTSEELTKQLEANQTKLFQLSNSLSEAQLEYLTTEHRILSTSFASSEIEDKIAKLEEERARLIQNMTLADLVEHNKIVKLLGDLDKLKEQYVKDLTVAQQKIGLNELQANSTKIKQRESELESKIDQTGANVELLKQKQTDLNEQFKVELNKSGSSFLKKPEDWVYEVGFPIGVSAILALASDVLGRYEKTKPFVKTLIFWSLIFMGFGFAFLIAIFFIVGGGPSYSPWAN